MTRLETAEAVKIAEELGLPVALAELNIFRVLLRNPPVAKATATIRRNAGRIVQGRFALTMPPSSLA